MTDEDILKVAGEFMEKSSSRRDVIDGITKDDLNLAIGSIATGIEANIATFDLSLPIKAQTGLIAKQKTGLFFLITKKLAGGG